jgi:hypothetical protein
MTADAHHYQLRNWNETRLWKQLEKPEKPESDFVRTYLNSWMPLIQTLLAECGTTPTDFTLHDSQHAFRVAERMVDIMPTDVVTALSSFELALLLLSAYLHDIGMCPEQGMLKQYHGYVLTGQPESLTPQQVEEFELWLDNWADDIEVPLIKGKATDEQLKMAALAAAHFCRSKHIEWGENWVEKKLLPGPLQTPLPFLEELKLLCRSHHQGYPDLIDDRFKPKPINNVIVHLRYLAVVLRVADIMEFDPERTPEVIFQHRDISPKSVIFWHKDHSISYQIEDGRLSIFAEPPDARIHRAVEETANDIETELRLARRIDDEKPFEVSTFQEKRLYHKWNILPDIRREIRPKNDAYEYIDGAFRPNTQKLLQLLSGKQLYPDELIAVRELLQNAFDAVREEIAHERLQKANPLDPELVNQLSNLHQVTLRFEKSDDRFWLVCEDDGVGMTKAIIRDYLLVSGTVQHPGSRQLERLCRDKGFSVGRTGEFGVGVLSYFMLADQVEVVTRRSGMCSDMEVNGWKFETSGVGYFGELRKDTSLTHGSRVRLRLRTAVAEAPDRWFGKLKGYLREILTFVPCRFVLHSDIPDCEGLELGHGWSKTPETLFKWWWSKSTHNISDRNENPLLTTIQRQVQEQDAAEGKRIREQIDSCIEWVTDVGMLPKDIGAYRFLFPVFRLPSGPSPLFFREEPGHGQIAIRGGGERDAIAPRGKLRMGWKGMSIEDWSKDALEQSEHGEEYLEDDEDEGYEDDEDDDVWVSALPSSLHRIVSVEIDWRDERAGILSVSRCDLQLSPDALEAIAWLAKRIVEVFLSFFCNTSQSPYVQLAHLIGDSGRYPDGSIGWKSVGKEKSEFYWAPMQFPVVGSISPRDEDSTFRWKGAEITPPPRFLYLIGKEIDLLRWYHSSSVPDRLVRLRGSSGCKLVPIWTTKPSVKSETFLSRLSSRFPPEFEDVALADGYWNKDHPLVRLFRAESFARIEKWESHDPRPYHSEIVLDLHLAAAWMAQMLYSETDMWEALAETEPVLQTEIWRLVLASEIRLVSLSSYTEGSEWQQCSVTPTGIQVSNFPSRKSSYFQSNDPEWIIERVKKPKKSHP